MNTKSRILIVDDIADNLAVLHAVLKDRYQVLATTSGAKAIELAVGDLKPDLILLDVMMPGMDGYSVCDAFKQNEDTRDIPLIFITTKSDAENEEKGFSVGAVDYITKPIVPAVLRQRVAKHLQCYKQKIALESEVLKQTLTIEKTRQEIIYRLCRAAEFKDNETAMHVERMSHYTHQLALVAGIGKGEAELMLQAAPMHDIGKIGIPDSILLKKGPLTDSERQTIEKHPEFGAKIIGEHDSPLLSMARDIALYHHEKWDGSGYPYGLSGEDIPLSARIVALADVFDALTTERPYKRAWTLSATLDLIKEEAGCHFDPSLVEVFLNNLPRFLELKERYKELDMEEQKVG